MKQLPLHIESDAIFGGENDAYRYFLSRRWSAGKILCWLMLNPSTADHRKNDPTVAKNCRWAAMLGFGGIFVGNAFAIKSTDPRLIRTCPDPIGPDNDTHIISMALGADMVICAWGNHGAFMGRGNRVLAMLRESGIKPHCMRLTKQGQPEHPLYLPMKLEPIPMEVPNA